MAILNGGNYYMVNPNENQYFTYKYKTTMSLRKKAENNKKEILHLKVLRVFETMNLRCGLSFFYMGGEDSIKLHVTNLR